MKTTTKYLILLFAFFFMASCEKTNDESLPKEEIQGGLIKHSDCKSFSNEKSSEVAADVSQADYFYDTLTNNLTLNHLNAGFNCCPSKLSCDFSIMNDTIFIEEKEEFNNDLACSCNCLYDLEILITGVEAKKYIVKFIEPRYSGDEKLIFEIDLTENKEGSYSVNRDSYPWGN